MLLLAEILTSFNVSGIHCRNKLTATRRWLVPFIIDTNGNGVSFQHVIAFTGVIENTVLGNDVTRKFSAMFVTFTQFVMPTFRLFRQNAAFSFVSIPIVSQTCKIVHLKLKFSNIKRS